jgi:hypothetical protein
VTGRSVASNRTVYEHGCEVHDVAFVWNRFPVYGDMHPQDVGVMPSSRIEHPSVAAAMILHEDPGVVKPYSLTTRVTHSNSILDTRVGVMVSRTF